MSGRFFCLEGNSREGFYRKIILADLSFAFYGLSFAVVRLLFSLIVKPETVSEQDRGRNESFCTVG